MTSMDSNIQALEPANAQGVHLNIVIAMLEGCPKEILDDPDVLADVLDECVLASGLTLLRRYMHKFSPQGVTGAAILAESHIAIHTWPERGTIFVDIATCSTGDASIAVFNRMLELIPHGRVVRRVIEMGDSVTPCAIQLTR